METSRRRLRSASIKDAQNSSDTVPKSYGGSCSYCDSLCERHYHYHPRNSIYHTHWAPEWREHIENFAVLAPILSGTLYVCLGIVTLIFSSFSPILSICINIHWLYKSLVGSYKRVWKYGRWTLCHYFAWNVFHLAYSGLYSSSSILFCVLTPPNPRATLRIGRTWMDYGGKYEGNLRWTVQKCVVWWKGGSWHIRVQT